MKIKNSKIDDVYQDYEKDCSIPQLKPDVVSIEKRQPAPRRPVPTDEIVRAYFERQHRLREEERKIEFCLTEGGQFLVPRLAQREKRQSVQDVLFRQAPNAVRLDRDITVVTTSVDLSRIILGPKARYVILADAGMGKTTLLKEVLDQVACAILETDRVPLYFHLRALTGSVNRRQLLFDIQDKFYGLGHDSSVIQQTIETLFEQGRFLFLLDGLDQIPEGHYPLAFLESPQVEALMGENGLILAGRPSVYEQLDRGRRLFEQFQVVTIEPFDHTRIRTFLGIYADHPQIQEIFRINSYLFTVPIFLAQIRFLAQHERLSHVATPSDLYKEMITTLLDDGIQKHWLYIGPIPDRDTTMRMLSRLSYEILKCGYQGSFPAKLKYPTLVDALHISNAELDALLRLGLVSYTLEDGADGAYVFRHQSFQEYFASLVLRELLYPEGNRTMDHEVFLDHLEWSYWDEVWLYLAGLLDAKQASLLIRTIGSYDPCLAAKCLGYSRAAISQPEKGLIGFLLNHLVSERNPAWGALTRMARNSVLQYLLSLSRSHKGLDRIHAARAFGTLTVIPRAVNERLLELSHDRKLEVRTAAVKTLGVCRITEPWAVDRLVTLLGDSHWEVRCAAIEALGALRVTESRVVDRLLALSKDSEPIVRMESVLTLGRLKAAQPTVIEQLLALCEDSDDGVRIGAVRAIGTLKIKEPWVVDKVLALTQNSVLAVRETATLVLGILGEMKEIVIEPILALSHDPEVKIRLAAAMALGELKARRPVVIERLLALSHDPDPFVRRTACLALGDLKATQPVVIERLLTLFQDIDLRISIAAGEALGALNAMEPWIVDRFLALLGDSEWQVRNAAVHFLGALETATPEVVKCLLDLTQDDWVLIAPSAAKALGALRVREPAVIDRLLALISDLSEGRGGLRREAAVALGRIAQVLPQKDVTHLVGRLKQPVLYPGTDVAMVNLDAEYAVKVIEQTTGRRFPRIVSGYEARTKKQTDQ